MINILLVIIGVFILYFVIKKLHVIAIAIFFGTIILMLSVTILRDQLHLPVNDYVDTTKLDELRDNYIPVEINNNQDKKVTFIPNEDDESKKDIEKEVITDVSYDEYGNEIYSYETLSEEENQAIIDRLNGKVSNIQTDNIDNTEKVDVKVEVKEPKNEVSEPKKKSEQKVYTYLYEDLTTEYRQVIIEQFKDKIKGSRFDKKLLGMNLYVDVTYEFENAIMYNDLSTKSLVIKFN